MKEAITKFDLEAAFKALDDIEIPKAGKVRANRPALNEIFSRKSKFDALMEEYYDVSNTDELEDAQEAREAEVAKAKLERIEKIVDLDADSPEDLLTSYVGKHIIQCPQCMTLFYKNPEDIVASEDDSNVVNVNEECQHCGNESGYNLVGKVGEAEPNDVAEEPVAAEVADEEIPEEPFEEESTEETSEEDIDLGGLEDIDLGGLGIEDDEIKEESFMAHGGEALVEEFADDSELDDKLEANNEYIEYLRASIVNEKEKLEKENNEQIKATIQKNIDSLNIDLEAALPDAVKNGTATAIEAEPEDDIDEINSDIDIEDVDVQEESCENVEGEKLTEALHEDADTDVSEEEFLKLINSSEFKKPISTVEVRTMFDYEKNENVEECANVDNSTETLTEAAITRAGKCDWVLANYVDTDGKKKYSKFLVVSLDVKKVGKTPMLNPESFSKDKASKIYGAKSATKYKDAERLAAGNSMKRDCGPVLVYFAADDNNPTPDGFLCQYIGGKLHNGSDQLNSFIKDIKGGKKAAKGKKEFEKRVASQLKADDKVKLGEDTATVYDIGESRFGDAFRNIELEFEDGSVEALNVSAKTVFNVIIDNNVTLENFDNTMSSLDELNESTLEDAISGSLVESYGNVAGFRLSKCNYTDNKLAVDGTIYFTSGKTRKTTYVFNESCKTEDDKISLRGLNEKLGLDKQFTLTGRIENKTLITESFKRSK